jgi:triacylglycerol lipase
VITADSVPGQPSGPAVRGRETTPRHEPGPELDHSWFSLSDLARPSLLLEQYAALELMDLLASPVYFGIGVPRGHGSPVLCLPGFLGSDWYLSILRGWLQSVGYRSYPSDFSIAAIGSPFVLVERAVRRADHIATATNERVTIVGHSLGGLIGRVVARVRPDLIAHVVTLGSPLGLDPRGAAHPVVRTLTHFLLRESRSAAGLRMERMLERLLFCAPVPDSVRVTSISSRQDAVVNWRDCQDTAPRTVAYAVPGTHCGLAWNAQVYRLLGQALASEGKSDQIAAPSHI